MKQAFHRKKILFLFHFCVMCACFAAFGMGGAVDARPQSKTQKRKATKRKVVRKKPVKPTSHRVASKARITPAMLRGKIVFMQDFDVWIINSDGSGKRKILAKPFGGNSIEFSPNYSHVAFLYDPPNDDPYLSNELFIMRIDGSQKRQLTNSGYVDSLSSPRFSPDGRQILYTRWTGNHWGGPMNDDADIWVVNVDGSEHRCVIGDYSEPDATHSGAAWSRDGKRLFFWLTKGDIPESTDATPPIFEPYSATLEGEDVRPLEEQWNKFVLPEISPDGLWRISESRWDARNRKYSPLTLENLQNRTTQPLTTDGNTIYSGVRWSPDSQMIAVQWSRSVSENNLSRTISGIDIMRRDGTQRKRLLDNATLIKWLP